MSSGVTPIDQRLRRLVLPPQSGTSEKAARTRMVYGFAWALIGTSLVFNLLGMLLTHGGSRWLVLLLGQIAIGLVTLVIVATGRTTLAAWFLVIASWVGMTAGAWTSGGLESTAIAAQLVVVVGAGLLLGWKEGLIAAAVATATAFGLAAAQSADLLPSPAFNHSSWSRASAVASYIVLIAVIVAVAMWNKRKAAAEALQELVARAAAEAALSESRAVLSAVVEGTTDAIFIKDLNGRYLFLNEAATRILGMPAEDVLGRDDTAVFPPEQAATIMAGARVVLELGHSITHEERISPGGSPLGWYLMTLGPLTMPDGTVIGTYNIGHDITERKLAEDRMRATLDSLLDPHVLVQAVRDDQGQLIDYLCLDANQSAADFFGIGRERLVGARLQQLLPAQTQTGLGTMWAHVIATGEPLVLDDYANRYALPTVNRRYDVRSVRVGDGVSHTWRDVTERHETEAALRRHVEELDALQRISRLLAEQSDLPAALDHASREIETLFSAEAARIRLRPEEGEAKDVTSLTLVGTVERFGACPLSREEATVQQVLTSGRSVTAEADDSTPYHYLSVPMVAASNEVGVLTIARERQHGPFTERELTVAQPVADALAAAVDNHRLHARETREAADNERQRLARDLHDAVTQNIYAANLIAGALPSLWRRSPTEGLDHLSTLRRLVRAALAEMRTLLFELRPGTLDETPLETLLLRLAEALEGHSEIEVEVSVSPDVHLPREVKLVFYRIAQEALSNIGKYARASEVSISVTRDDASVRLVVRDDGRGFDVTATRPDSMGLRIMRERGDEIGATVAVESAPERGTSVRVTWPCPAGGLPETSPMTAVFHA